MKTLALNFTRFGPPTVLTLIERDVPVPKQGEVLIEVEAAAINPSDIRIVEGLFHSPLPRTPGRDYAGVVVGGAAQIDRKFARDPQVRHRIAAGAALLGSDIAVDQRHGFALRVVADHHASHGFEFQLFLL